MLNGEREREYSVSLFAVHVLLLSFPSLVITTDFSVLASSSQLINSRHLSFPGFATCLYFDQSWPLNADDLTWVNQKDDWMQGVKKFVRVTMPERGVL